MSDNYYTPPPKKKSFIDDPKISPQTKIKLPSHIQNIQNNLSIIYRQLFGILFPKMQKKIIQDMFASEDDDNIDIENFIYTELDDCPEYNMMDDTTKQYIYAFQNIMKYVYKLLKQPKNSYLKLKLRPKKKRPKNLLEVLKTILEIFKEIHSKNLQKQIKEDLDIYVNANTEQLLNYITSIKLSTQVDEELEDFYDAFYVYFDCVGSV